MVKKLSLFFLVLSIVSIIVCFTIIFYCGCVDVLGAGGAAIYFWLFFAIIPISIVSIIFSIVCIKKGKKKKIILIASLIVFMLKVATGFILLMDFNRYDYSNAIFTEVATKTNLVLPTSIVSAVTKDNIGVFGNAKIKDKTEEKIFVDSSKQYPWKYELPLASKGLIPPNILSKTSYFDSFCLYVDDIQTFNPEYLDNTKHNFYYLAYRKVTHQIFVYKSLS